MQRFVILEHDHPELHWDLMLETGTSLRTWRLAAPPEVPGERIAATALPAHRLHYLNYQGPVSGNRGTVKRWDAGCYEENTPSCESAALELHLAGARVHGRAWLTPLTEDRWIFEWHGEPSARAAHERR